jgi:hypothetical protein
VRDFEWNDVEKSLAHRSFYSRPMRLFFHLPMNLAVQMEALLEEVRMKNYELVEPIFMIREDGTFGGKLMVEIKSLRFFDPRIVTFDERPLHCVVSTRPWGQLGPDVLKVRSAIEESGDHVERVYLWHTTCPRCRDFRGYQTVIMGLPESPV